MVIVNFCVLEYDFMSIPAGTSAFFLCLFFFLHGMS